MSGATGISFPLGYVPRDNRSYCASMAARIRALVTPGEQISAPARQGVWKKFVAQAREALGERATEAQIEETARELRRLHMSALARLPRAPRGSGGSKSSGGKAKATKPATTKPTKQPLKTNSAPVAAGTEPRGENPTQARSRNESIRRQFAG